MREDIIKKAKEVGAHISYSPDEWDIWKIRDVDLERFFHMAQADMKEKCAKFLEETDICGDAVVDELAAAIRAIGDSHDQT